MHQSYSYIKQSNFIYISHSTKRCATHRKTDNESSWILKYQVHWHSSSKVRPRTGHEGPEGEQRYSSTLSLTSALDGCGWSTPRLGRFTPRKDPVPTVRVGGPHSRSGRVRKISPPKGFDSRTVQPVASRYTDCAIPALHSSSNKFIELNVYNPEVLSKA